MTRKNPTKRYLDLENNDSGNEFQEFSGADDDDNETACLYCNDLYSRSRSREKWIQCMTCKSWCHTACADVSPRSTMFICDIGERLAR